MKNINKSSIFDGLSQAMDTLDPAKISPILDRVLVRDVGETEKVGMLFVPQSAKERGMGKNGLFRRGVVVSVGPGDKWVELGFSKDGVRRKRVACQKCAGTGLTHDPIAPEEQIAWVFCSACDGACIGRLPMRVEVGQTVIYDRRKDQEITIKGVRLSLLNLEQSLFAVMEGSVVRPLQDKIVVQYAAKETESSGGIAIPEAAQEKSRLGVVISTGPGKMDVDGNLIPLDVKVGDTVLFGNYAGADIEVDGETFLLMKEEAVLGVVGQ